LSRAAELFAPHGLGVAEDRGHELALLLFFGSAVAVRSRLKRAPDNQKNTRPFNVRYHSASVIPSRVRRSTVSVIGLLSRITAVPWTGCRIVTDSGRRRLSIRSRAGLLTSNRSSRADVDNNPWALIEGQDPASATWNSLGHRSAM